MVHRVVCLNLQMIPKCPARDSEVDRNELQSDLDVVCKWIIRWQIEVNVIKCKSIRYSTLVADADSSYSMYGKPTEKVSSKKTWVLFSPGT